MSLVLPSSKGFRGLVRGFEKLIDRQKVGVPPLCGPAATPGMRKRLIEGAPDCIRTRGESWLAVERAAVVEFTSEEKNYPVESVSTGKVRTHASAASFTRRAFDLALDSQAAFFCALISFGKSDVRMIDRTETPVFAAGWLRDGLLGYFSLLGRFPAILNESLLGDSEVVHSQMEYVLPFLEFHRKRLNVHSLFPEGGNYLARQSRALRQSKLKLF